MGRGRGAQRAPGEVRRTQNWIGGTRPGNAVFVPPPPQSVPECLGALERFLHDDPEPSPTLVKAALSHVQFETIHPFLDGNGRVGRLLITLLLCAEGVIREPLLFVSLYFKEHRQTYYDLLNAVRVHGDWETWLEFFAEAVIASAAAAFDSSQRLLALVAKDRARVEALGRASRSALAVHGALSRAPIGTAASLVQVTGLTAATVNKALTHLENLRIVAEVTKRQRDRVWSYRRYVAILGEGIDGPSDGVVA
jgi:Fic family protein